MEDYSVCLNSLTQVGSFRNAALMGQLQVSHPDIFEFIHCKDTCNNLKNFNISVQVTDEFMDCVDKDSNWDLVNPRNNEVVRTVRARDVWSELISSAHLTGDPGLAFIDRVIETQPNPNIGVFGSNPCSEQYLENFNSCNLGSINLGNFVKGGCWEYDRLANTVRSAVRFLNNVIDVNIFPFPELKDMSDLTRRIGLGVMGWADALVSLNICYDSYRALDQADNIGNLIYTSALEECRNLAKKEGAFPNFEFSTFAKNNEIELRNSCLTSIAPTGTISRLSNSSFGIEPYFALAWNSNILWEGDKSTELLDCPISIRKALESTFGKYNEDAIIRFLALLRDSEKKDDQYELLKSIGLKPELYPISNNIDPLFHVDMLSTWQQHCTNGVSKTVNMPNDSSIESVEQTYLHAWHEKCKGITVYREGIRETEILSKNNKSVEKIISNDKYLRPSTMSGQTHKILTGHGKMYITVNTDNSVLREVISNIGRSGGCSGAAIESVSRLVSLCLQNNIDISEIIKQLSGITCCPAWDNGKLVKSPSDAISKVLEQYIINPAIGTTPDNVVDTNTDNFVGLCTSCNSGVIVNVGGCPTCSSCGASKCG